MNIFTVIFIAIFGVLLQIILWSGNGITYLQAIYAHPLTWLFHIFIGSLIAEHSMNFFRRRKNRDHGNTR
jgi:hypothetical protein